MVSKLLGRLARISLLVLITLALLELVLRLWALAPGETKLFRDDPRLGFRMRPNLDLSGVKTNGRGFNDVDRPVAKAPGVERLAVIGDSFVCGVVARQDNFVSVLGELYRQAGKPIEVLNLGIPASGPKTYLSVLEHEATELQVDRLVVMFFVGNDLEQSRSDFVTRVFFGGPRELLEPPYLVRFSADYFYSLRLFRSAWRSAGEGLDRWRHGKDAGTFSRRAFLDIERQRAEIFLRDSSPWLAERYSGAFSLLRRMDEAARQRGMSFAVVLAPDEIQVDASLRAELADVGKIDFAAYDLAKPQRILVDGLASAGIPCLDLLPAFLREGVDRRLYRSRDTHWNEEGNDLAAREIYAFLGL